VSEAVHVGSQVETERSVKNERSAPDVPVASGRPLPRRSAAVRI
jgi:hypothetical protein